ncbi:MAG TPA: hypothetical protein PKE04_08750, partial [Clostridia bacterium]|nr:hypothetical protein [Clostridia bacterium]
QAPSTTPAPKVDGANRLQDGASNARDRAQEADSRTRATHPPEPEAYVAPYLSSTRSFMDALRADLVASEFGDISVKHATTTARKDGCCTVEYRMRYAGYYATARFECAPYGSIQSVDFRFPCGRSYLEEFDYRFGYDMMIMMAACGGFLQNGVDDALLLLMSDLHEDILTAMQGWDAQEWIWQGGYGFFATYESGTREAVLTIRVGEPVAI